MIEWKPLPDEPWNILEEQDYLIYLPKSGRVVSASHDAANYYFLHVTSDTEHVYSYRNISHYAELNLPEAIESTENA